MHVRLIKYLTTVRSSYWFIPSLMAIGAMLLSIVMTSIDTRIGDAWMGQMNLTQVNKPEGARTLLSTIAGSMITVAGVTFSITIAALAYASSQFGPRLLTNFMNDVGHQFTLGTFIATFLYCLLVLRTIRSPDEPLPGVSVPEAELLPSFVPHLSILVGLFFALASIGVLIYFIHHVPGSLRASHVVAHIGQELHEKIADLYPETIGLGVEDAQVPDPEADVPERFFEDAVAVEAGEHGYVQYVDEEQLLWIAIRHDLVLRLVYRPGDFVNENRALAYAWPADHVDETVTDEICAVFSWGWRRTHTQDALFLINELVEIAARALSPGINDPFTAINCMDWLGSALTNLGTRRFPSAYRYDTDRKLRVISHAGTFTNFLDATFDQLRPYTRRDRNAALHLMKVIGEVGWTITDERYLKRLEEHATALCHEAQPYLTHERDRAALEHRHRTVLRLLHDPAARVQLSDELAWFAGSA